MPFGLSNAGSVYSLILDLAMACLPADYWLYYFDDILVCTLWIPGNTQKQDGLESFIGCWGWKCNHFEKHYPSIKRELKYIVSLKSNTGLQNGLSLSL